MLKTDIDKIPKAELHAHLNGSIPMDFIIDTATERGILDQPQMAYLQTRHNSLSECFGLFPIIQKVIQNQEILVRAIAHCLDEFSRCGVTYLELRTTPKSHLQNLPDFEAYTHCIIETTNDYLKKHPDGALKEVRWILSIDRRMDRKTARRVVAVAKAFFPAVVGIDFSGDPTCQSFLHFRDLFEDARNNALGTTVHFAEIPNDSDGRHILDFAPDRLGHGYFLLPEHEKLFLQKNIPVEVCLTSNAVTTGITDFTRHTLSKFRAWDHPFVLCTDDFGIFDQSLCEEYANYAHAFNTPLNEIKALAKSAFQYKLG